MKPFKYHAFYASACLIALLVFSGGCTSRVRATCSAVPPTSGAVSKQEPSPTQIWIDDMLALAGQTGPCIGFVSEEDLFLFINAGYAAIPELIRHVRDERPTGLSFAHPRSSTLDPESKSVGMVACYLIEAILRRDPYFTWSCRLLYEPSPDLDEVDKRKWVLDQAATRYEQWFEDCFDEATNTLTCPPDQLPKVDWAYDLGWERYLNSGLKRCGDASQIVGKFVASSRVGRSGYMLLLSDDAWLSCFLSEDDRDGID